MISNLWVLLFPALLLGGGAYLIWGKRTKKGGGSNQNTGTGNGTANAATSTKKPLWKIVLTWFVILNIIGLTIHLLRSCDRKTNSVVATQTMTTPQAENPGYISLGLNEWSRLVRIAPGSTISITLRASKNQYGHPELRKADLVTVVPTPTDWWDVQGSTLVLTNKGSEMLEGRFVMIEDQPTR